jgi:hypothetical protein
MARLPKGPPKLRDVLREQRELQRKQGTASAFVGTGSTATGYVDNGDASTLAAAKSYTDAATTMPGMEAPYAALTIPAGTVAAVPWGAPSENTGGFVVAGNAITIPAGMGGVYAVTATLAVADSQPTRGFVDLYSGSLRSASRGVFTGDSVCTVNVTARVASLSIIKAEIYCGTATSLTGGWITLYRLHS